MFGVILPTFYYPRRVLFGLSAALIIYLFIFSSPVRAVTTAVSNLPSVIGSDPFSLAVSIANASPGTNYLRVDFYKEGTTNYFGETFNDSSWYNGSDGKQYFPITISGNSATANFQSKIGSPSTKEFDGQGQYRLRVRRYTASGNYNSAEANASSVSVSINLPTPTPTVTPTPIPTPTPTVTPTPTSTPTPTPTPTTVSYPDGIYLSEFMPNPNSGEKEWVEVYNSNSSSVELTNWKIDDKDGGSSPQDFTVTLGAQVFKQLFFSSTKLNNDSDTVRLLKPDLSVADSYSYSVSHKGNSWAKNNSGSWFETSAITPNEENKFIPVGGFPHKDGIVELKKLTIGSTIDLTATVSLPLDIFDEKEFYVVDDYSGIKISVVNLPSFKLKLGDKIHVASTIEESYSEKYIKSDTYEIIQSNLRYPDPWEIETGEITEVNEGKLVKISGKYKESDGDNFYIDDGTGAAKIYLKPSAGIIKLKMSSDDQIEVQGVVSQYGFLKDGKPNYRLMPRFQSDLRNLTSERKLAGTVLGAAIELPVTGAGSFSPALIMVGLGLVLKIVLKFSREDC